VVSKLVMHYYMDGFKVLHCERSESLAGPLGCRVKKTLDVHTICLRAEVLSASPKPRNLTDSDRRWDVSADAARGMRMKSAERQG
jgi:hypothetical protein